MLHKVTPASFVTISLYIHISGDAGDNFYVIDEGTFNVYIKKEGVETKVNRRLGVATTVTSTAYCFNAAVPSLCNHGSVQSGAMLLSVSDPQHAQVKSMGPGESFGELALMYSTPRTATCKAVTKARLWALDRISFKVSELQGQRFDENFESIPHDSNG